MKVCRRKVSVIGLGYVGLPVAIEFGKIQTTIAFDVNFKRIEELKSYIDINLDIKTEDLLSADLHLTSNPEDLKLADFHIVAIPTPVDKAKCPDLSNLKRASELLGRQLKKGDIVVYESTVYPGVTEEECLPILERFSNLKSGIDFFIGYSPERINIGDEKHKFKNTCKIISGQTSEVLEIISEVYSLVVKAGLHKAPNIKTAEAAKILENVQRDVNIALINELAVFFKRLNIDTSQVLTAASTKWNFLPFTPGLVGGHCIGVDSYYLIHKANMLNVDLEMVSSGRKVNGGIGKYIAEQTIEKLSKFNKSMNSMTIGVLGITFKENCNDIRDTGVISLIRELTRYNTNILIHDPLADPKDVKEKYNIDLCKWVVIMNVDAIILAIPHDFYLNNLVKKITSKTVKPKVLIDIKGRLDKDILLQQNIEVWRL